MGRFRFWLLILLLLATKDAILLPAAQPLPAGCRRFFSLLPQTSAPTPSLLGGDSAANPEPPFSHAAHTLFLDESMARIAADIGFDTIVQVFPWRDLNPAPDDFSWQAADVMVQTAGRYNLNLVVRLDMPPAWAKRPDPQRPPGRSGLPFDLEAYARFISAVARRYRGRILAYIIWNEPNLAAEWSRSGSDLEFHWSSYSGWVADPADYVGLLGVSYRLIKLADPGILIVTAGLAPTNENSPRAVDDRAFLQQMLAAGAAQCFDVLGVHAYGYGLDPDVHRQTQDALNLARILDLHDIMLANGADKRIWITELGYTIGPGQHPSVTEKQQAEYLTGALLRARREWPWVDLLTVWNLAYGLSADDEMSGYSLIEPDLTPRLAYGELQQLLKAASN